MGESQNQPFQLSFNRFLRVDFQGSRVTSDGRLILVRELDERFGLSGLIGEHLVDSRTGRNQQFLLADLLRQSVYSRLAGYEDLTYVPGYFETMTEWLLSAWKSTSEPNRGLCRLAGPFFLKRRLAHKEINMFKRKVAILGIVFVALVVATPGVRAQDTKQAEREAMYYRYVKFPSLVKGGSVQAHWMADGSSFWYAEGAPANTVIWKVDPKANTKTPLFARKSGC